MRKRSWASRAAGRHGGRRVAAPAVFLAIVLLSAALVLAGCGLETEQANKDLALATQHQADAEAILARLKAFPGDWQAIFNASRITQAEIDRARALVAAREKDLDAFDQALKDYAADLALIKKLNVDMKIKEYIGLKLSAIKLWQEYSTMYLRPLVKAYSGMVEIIAYGRPASEQAAKAQEITNIVGESVQKLEECRNADRVADDYFKDNKLGK